MKAHYTGGGEGSAPWLGRRDPGDLVREQVAPATLRTAVRGPGSQTGTPLLFKRDLRLARLDG